LKQLPKILLKFVPLIRVVFRFVEEFSVFVGVQNYRGGSIEEHAVRSGAGPLGIGAARLNGGGGRGEDGRTVFSQSLFSLRFQ
jgi:hypothetical protein